MAASLQIMLLFLPMILPLVGLALGVLAVPLLVSVALAPDPPELRRQNLRRCYRLLAASLALILLPIALFAGLWAWQQAGRSLPNGCRVFHDRDVDETYIVNLAGEILIDADVREDSLCVRGGFVTGRARDGGHFAINTKSGEAVFSFDAREVDRFLGAPVRGLHDL